MKNLILIAFLTVAVAIGGTSLAAQNTSKVKDNKRTVRCEKHKQGNFAKVDGTKVVVKVVNVGGCAGCGNNAGCGGGGCGGCAGCGGGCAATTNTRCRTCKKRNFAAVRKASKKPTVDS